MRKRPSGVFFLVLLSGFMTLFLLISGNGSLNIGYTVWGTILITGGISSFFIGLGLWRMKNWARWSAIVFYGLVLIWAVLINIWPITIFGVILCGLIICYLSFIVNGSVWERENFTFLRSPENGVVILGIGSAFVLSYLVGPLLLIPLIFSLGFGLVVYTVIGTGYNTHKRLGLIFYIISLLSLVFLFFLGVNAGTSFGFTIKLLSLFTTPSIPFFLLVGRALRGGF